MTLALFYPQITQMTLIFLGCAVLENHPHSGRNAIRATHTAS